MQKILIITNIPSPYRIDFFSFIQNEYTNFEFSFLFTNVNEDNREWDITLNKISNVIVLNSFIFKYSKDGDKKYIHFPKGLLHNLNKLDPDIIIASEYNISAVLSLIWAKLRNKKFINLTDGTINSEKNINFVQRILRKIIILHSDSLIASSSMAKEKLLMYGANEKNVFISYLTEDLKDFLEYKCSGATRDSDDTKVLLCVGQIIERKGIDLLLKALSRINNNYILNIVGNGDCEYIDYIKKIIEELKLNKDDIKFKGFKKGNDLIKEYFDCDIFVFPTRCDCYGLVMLEAMAMCKYQIVSKFADGAYDIIDNENGIIIDPYNTDEFAKALENTIKDLPDVGIIKDKIKKFDFENTAKPFVAAINFVI